MPGSYPRTKEEKATRARQRAERAELRERELQVRRARVEQLDEETERFVVACPSAKSCTQEVIDTVADAVRGSMSVSSAFALADVPPANGHVWLTRGRAAQLELAATGELEDPSLAPYMALALAVDKALARAEQGALECVLEHLVDGEYEGSLRAAEFLLERRFGWSRKTEAKVEARVEHSAKVPDFSDMSAEDAAQGYRKLAAEVVGGD